MKRVVFDILLFLSIFTLPWLVTVLLAFVGIFIWKNFYEFIGAGVIMYALFAIPDSGFLSSPLWFPLTISLIYIGVQILRRYIILYQS